MWDLQEVTRTRRILMAKTSCSCCQKADENSASVNHKGLTHDVVLNV